MNIGPIIAKLFVKPFYRENAGTFLFVLTMMFCIVSKVDGAGLYEYHYVLIHAMLSNPFFLLLVFAAWFLYARKCFSFINNLLSTQAFRFADILNSLPKRSRVLWFLLIHVLLMMPCWLYTLFIIYEAYTGDQYMHMILIIVYLLSLSLASSFLHTRTLDRQLDSKVLSFNILRAGKWLPNAYPVWILRFVAAQQKMVWVAIKLFSCGVIYLYAKNTPLANQDMAFAFLLFNFGVLANGLLVNRIREYEETYLSFHRAMPVSLQGRWLQYLFIYILLLLPEGITLFSLAPAHLGSMHAFLFFLSAASTLLLLNSISFFQHFNRKEYFKGMVVIFFVQCALFMTAGLLTMSIVFLGMAIFFFSKNYYRFETLM